MNNLTIYKSNLSAKEIMVYNYLKTCCNSNNTCFPSIKTIAINTKMSVATVKRALNKLEDYKFIERESRYRSCGGKSSNMYILKK